MPDATPRVWPAVIVVVPVAELLIALTSTELATLCAPPLDTFVPAVNVLDADPFYRQAFGDTLVSYLVMMKRAEIGRYASALTELPLPEGQDVSDWEMREYFEFF